jgi:hypothetical protein
LLFFLIWVNSIYAQNSKWKQGFIINLKKDTIYGFIRLHSSSSFYKIDFKKDINEKFKIIESKDIKQFAFANKIYYSIFISKDFAGMSSFSFAEKIEDGNIALFFCRYRYLTCPCEPLGGVNEGFVMTKNGNVIHIINKKSFSKFIKAQDSFLNHLIDNENLYQAYLYKKIQFKMIPQIIKTFNENS